MFDLQRIQEIHDNPKRFRLLEEIPYSADDAFPIQIHPAAGDEITIALIDLETTGFNAGADEIIEIGLVQVAYSPTVRKITSIIEITSQFEQPSKPISELITNITGITNEMVAGKKIDDAHVARIFNSSQLMVAHNARFDRSFSDIRFKALANKPWACSVKDIDWYTIGFESAKLEYLLLKNGYFYSGHRAATDCLAMVALFEAVPNALPELLQSASKASIKIEAKGVGYNDREVVKGRGYKWNGDGKFWWHIVSEDDYAEEKAFLDQLCGASKHRNTFTSIPLNERHSS